MSMIDYNEYINMQTTPPGAVLRHILKRLGMQQAELANIAAIRPQRIYDLITGKRKFTPENSLKIERALSINLPGFFYRIQASYLIHQELLASQAKPDLSKFRKIIFWDSDISKIDWQGNARWVIKRVAEYGNAEEMNEIIKFYGESLVQTTLKTNSRNRRIPYALL